MTLVVDACVLRSAGMSGKPLPSQCRSVLEEIRLCGKSVSVDEVLLAEWKRHRSIYSATWIVSMYSRKLIDKLTFFSGKSASVESAIGKLSEPDRSVAFKDLHLLKIAVDRGYCVISCERRCRAAFHRAAAHCNEISKVAWIFPSYTDSCECIAGRHSVPHEYQLCVGE